VHFSGALEVPALERALQQLIARHDSLRATFSADGRWMTVLESMPLQIEHVELGGAEAIHSAIRNFMDQTVDLANGPLLRCALIRSAAEEHRLLLLAHHIVCDGWSMAQLLVELGALYSADVDGKPVDLEPAPRYTEYAAIERRFHGDSRSRNTNSMVARATRRATSATGIAARSCAAATASLCCRPRRPAPVRKTERGPAQARRGTRQQSGDDFARRIRSADAPTDRYAGPGHRPRRCRTGAA
jgi:hypothetical protein